MITAEELLTGLNQQQLAAVTAPISHLLVLAGAGSGKTRVLVHRMAWLVVHEHLSLHAVLAVTFTNKAAAEMKTRLHEVLQRPVDGLWVGTFHGLCHRMLRKHHQEANLPQHFHILDSDDQARIIKRIMHDMNLNVEQWPVKQVQNFINSSKDEGLRAAEVMEATYGPRRVYLEIYRAYEKACQISGVVDFAELMLRTLEMLRRHEELLQRYRQAFKVILVDEFQDTNTIQYAWIRLLAGASNAVMVVGDDDQSIYGWRGAKIENIHRFQTDFTGSQLIRLEQNYRSTATILNAANALIANNPTRMGKDLWTHGASGDKIGLYTAFNELEEAHFVSACIQQEKSSGLELQNIAILYRSNAQSRVLEEALLRNHIAYRIYGGMRYFERAEVKDTLAYLRLIINQNDDAAFERVVNVPARGIGDKTMQELKNLAGTQQCSFWLAAVQLIQAQLLPERARKALGQFLELITQLAQATAALLLSEQIQHVLVHSGLQQYYGNMKGDVSDSKLANLQELINAASEFRFEDAELSAMVAFLAHASLDVLTQDTEGESGYVHLMTLHAAKGLEFPRVFLVGMEEGVFPSKQSQEDEQRLQEERRLCYVGMTRAMHKLTLTAAETRRQYGRSEHHHVSRFVKELPLEYLQNLAGSIKKTTSYLPTSPAVKSAQGYYLGQEVYHPKFGQGIIIDLEGSAQGLKAQVRFADLSSKWLLLAYAKLRTTA